MPTKRIDLLICCGSGCVSAGALRIKDRFIEELKKNEIYDEVNIIETGCMGPCDFGPVLMVYPEGIFYIKVTPEDAEEIVNEHFIKGRPVKRLMQQEKDKTHATKDEIPFYQKQIKVALEHCGYLNPEKIEEYIALGGYEALANVLNNKPEDAIEIIKRSGLRGRGGAGFPTGMKWEFVNKAKGSPKYVVCNADEGDPGAFMDRSLLEGDPHRVLEGMMIAAYSVGASEGYFYIRAEYPLAITRIKLAIEQAKEYGLMGNNILGTEFSFDAFVRTGAGAFVCGEETALISSIMGQRGQPIQKPPYPANEGLWKKPTLVNNVETLGNIAPIFNKGPEWFSSMGTETSKGTKVFALTGDVKNTGLVEVPMGITVKDLIYEVGGGIVGDNKFKAVQLGGPSGGCLTNDHLDVKIDYESLKEKGAMMGSGGVIVMNDSNCMVNIAKFFLEFSVDESCGKCAPCRIGLKQMYEILDKITKGKGKPTDIDELVTLGNSIKQLSLCGLGQTAPNPVLSTIKYFREEYEEHINNQACPTKVCLDLMHYVINKDKCIGCSLCARRCPTSCISGSRQDKFTIAQVDCVKCGNCMEVCPVKAITKESGMHPDMVKHLKKLEQELLEYQ
ncbi:MAG TPA: NADH-quinone oxidoreductase subunit NuoF [Candidatus Cloacimonadota bacterium]|nr:NADH-quinone oxidoreductase subunit NuoF [Candidatus Cloacimonadota bacterium]HOQ79845.1 NADH-quinone oxidoreductase subunit NuoF [Candidatus Cloacimonadota bacterium]HPK40347.1 NADH-quinone oxidoreductase subunit NuoF [Candidatus Cloacimonadota bacterium]